MSTKAAGGAGAEVGLGIMSVLLLVLTGNSYRLARRGDYQAHKDWMARSYVLLCSSIIQRVLIMVANELGFRGPNCYTLTVWLSWVPSMLILELILWEKSQPLEVMKQ